MNTTLRVVSWAGSAPPAESELRKLLADESLKGYVWSNGPGDVYGVHVHDYNKVIYVIRGSIAFGLPHVGRTLTLAAGDRLDLPAGTVHDAVVGESGVACLEAHW